MQAFFLNSILKKTIDLKTLSEKLKYIGFSNPTLETPKHLILQCNEYFNAKGHLMGNPRPQRLDIGVIFENESNISSDLIPILSRLILSMLKYTRRQRALIPEILDDPFFL